MVLSLHILKLIKTRLVLCCDSGKIVATSNMMFEFTYVMTMRNIVAIETFLAISESKVNYVATKKFDSQVNLCRDIQNIVVIMFFSSRNIGYLQFYRDIVKLCHDRVSCYFQKADSILVVT